MTKKENYEKKTEQLLIPLLQKNSFELVDVEYIKEGSNFYLRAYIDKEGGITIDDCEKVSRELSDCLDETDFIPEAYILEVSSPGLSRQLKKDRDFQWGMGKEVEVKLFKPIEKTKEFSGILLSYNEKDITLRVSENESVSLSRDGIASVRLVAHF